MIVITCPLFTALEKCNFCKLPSDNVRSGFERHAIITSDGSATRAIHVQFAISLNFLCRNEAMSEKRA